MRRVVIQKIVHNESLAFVTLGKSFEGLEPSRPTVGKEYMIFDDAGRVLRTSYVVNLHDGFFETQNSYYKITVLEEEPFDLRGKGDSPQRTQEIRMNQLMGLKR